MSEIVFDRVGHAFEGEHVVRDVSLTISERRVGIVGANGSGKSTLARMINGLVEPSEGRVTVDGLDVSRHGREVRRRVGFVFTNADTQIVMPTVREDVAFSLRRLKLPKPDASARVDAALERFGLTALADRPAHRLSGGQKQLLALAAVLVAEPAVVVADEPTTLLDARNARRVARHFASLDEQLVVVSHQLELLEDFDRVIVMEAGRVVCDDVPAVALASYRELIEHDPEEPAPIATAETAEPAEP
jgi:biotin transport system ATP-binding protein